MEKNYKINPKWELILKTNKELLCVMKPKKTKKIKLTPNDIKQVTFILSNKKFKYINNTLFKKMLKEKIIIESVGEVDNTILENTNEYFSYFKTSNIKELSNKVIAIIGLGGIGTEVLKHLIGLNMTNFILIDYDKVEINNLNRQYLYTERDVGIYKADVIKEKYKDKNIIAIKKKITSYTDLKEILKKHHVDLLVNAADKPFLDLRIAVLRFSIDYKTPCTFASVGVESGQHGPLIDNRKNGSKYLKELTHLKSHVILSNTINASFGPTNSIISSYLTKDILFYLLNNKKMVLSLNKVIKINFN